MVALCRMPLAPRCRSLQFCRRSSRPGVPGHAKLQEVAGVPEAPRDGMPRAPHRSIELSCACLPVPRFARRAVCQAWPLPGRAWACETAGTCRAAAASPGACMPALLQAPPASSLQEIRAMARDRFGRDSAIATGKRESCAPSWTCNLVRRRRRVDDRRERVSSQGGRWQPRNAPVFPTSCS